MKLARRAGTSRAGWNGEKVEVEAAGPSSGGNGERIEVGSGSRNSVSGGNEETAENV